MSKTWSDCKIRGFQVTVQPGNTGYGIALEETNGTPKDTTTVAKADEKHTHAVLSSLVAAVKASGHPRTVLGPQRKAPIVLTEEVGVRLALTLVATAPISKARRIDTMLGNIDNMAVEEAYYWYAKCMGPNAGRVRKALRIFLAEE
jgi:hypothetical protein